METTYENPAAALAQEQKLRELDAHYCARPDVIEVTWQRLMADVARLDAELAEAEGVDRGN